MCIGRGGLGMVNAQKQFCSFSISCIGFSHLKNGKPCQDHSCHFQDGERVIITACDGHGGDLYIRSQIGSRFASEAICKVFGSIDQQTPISPKKIRLEILCAWNTAVENDLSQNPIREEELKALDERLRFQLRKNPFLAYGTTLHGAMILGDQLCCASIGDGGIFAIRDNSVIPILQSEDEDTVANITHSMCEENAIQHLLVSITDFKEYDSILACTDGTLNPYHSMDNFSRSFALPIIREAKAGNFQEIGRFMNQLGAKLGTGDDVSLAMIFRMEEKPEQEKKPEDPEETK